MSWLSHLRRGGIAEADDGAEVFGWREIAKGLVWSVVVEVVGEAIDEGLELVELAGQVMAGV